MKPATVTCPRCQEALEAVNYEGVQVELCRKCQGLLIVQDRMLVMLESMTRELQQEVDLNAPLETVEDPGGELACPRCRKKMNHHGYMETRWAFIDSCLPCGAVWVGADELGVISLIYARSRRRSQDVFGSRYTPPSLAPRIRANQLGEVVIRLLG